MIGMEENLAVGKMMSRSISLLPETLAMEILWGSLSLSLGSLATKNSATSSRGSIVALIPILWTSEETTVSIRARLRERRVPLLVGTSECISSIIIHLRSLRWGLHRLDARIKPRDSGVVISM